MRPGEKLYEELLLEGVAGVLRLTRPTIPVLNVHIHRPNNGLDSQHERRQFSGF